LEKKIRAIVVDMIYFHDGQSYLEGVISKCKRLDNVILKYDEICVHDFMEMNQILSWLSHVSVLNHLVIRFSDDSWLKNPDAWTTFSDWNYTLNLSHLEITATNKGAEVNHILRIQSKTLTRVKIALKFQDDSHYGQLESGLIDFLKFHANALKIVKLDIRCECEQKLQNRSNVLQKDSFRIPNLNVFSFYTSNLKNSKLLALIGRLIHVSNLKKQKLGKEIVDFMIFNRLKSTAEETKFIDNFTNYLNKYYRTKIALLLKK